MKLFTHRVPSLAATLAVLAACAATAAAQAPTLAELARKEQERRKAAGSATKVITNKDLPKPTAVPAGDAGAPATDPDAAVDAKATDEKKAVDEKDQKDEPYWRGRMVGAREDLRRGEMFMDALQSRINALSADFVNRDDPYQRAKIGEERLKALSELERVKADIGKARKEITDIEEEARQAGVPPGWLR